MGKTLPNNWVETELGQIVSFIIGGDWGNEPKEYVENSSLVLCIRGGELKDWRKNKGNSAVLRRIKNSSLEKRQLKEGDILLEISGGGPDQPVGRTVYIDHEVLNFNPETAKICTNFFRQVRLYSSVNSNYVNYYLQYFYITGEISKYQGGSNNLRNLKYKEYETISIPFPPLAEQERIVAKLDILFIQLDTIRSAMDRIPPLLKNFRQQVLSMAVAGKLTEEWRMDKKLEEWTEAKLENIALVIDPHPSHRTPPIYDSGIPYISIGDINEKKNIDFENARKVNPKILDEHKNRYTLKNGDFIFGKIGTIGKPVKIPQQQNYCLSANVILIQPDDSKINSNFLFHYLDSSILMRDVASQTNATSQPAFGIKKMRGLYVPIPSLLEQEEIVRRVGSLFSKADIIEQQYNSLKQKIDKLPQAILHKAFKGELVEQLPTDGDARDLLAQIEELNRTMKKK